MTTGALVLIILAVILAQISIVMLLGLYRRRQQYRKLGKIIHPAENISKPNTLIHSSTEPVTPDFVWEGFKEFVVQRREMENENSSICSFYLVPTDNKPLATFKPGQFLTFKLQIEDPVSHEFKSVIRCYSLSDAYRTDYYRISIKRVSALASESSVAPGVSSSYFHDHLQEGSRLLVKAPSGHFHLMEDEPLPIVLIGGGIGITPMLSILNSVLERGIKRDIWLYYGVRNSDEHIMKKHLQSLVSKHDNFHLHVCYSAPNESDVKGIYYQHNGRVEIPLLRATLKMRRYQFYVCGPKPMMESLVPGLKEWGVNSDDIYYESFGPASLIKHEKVVTMGNGQPITVTFNRSGKSIPWNVRADSLLEFAEANDIKVDSGCRAGSCGTCQTEIKSGEVYYNQEPDADVVAGHCLLCICKPKIDLSLDA